MNYQSWLAKWLETYVSPVVKGKTLETYRGVVKDHLVPALGELELAELTPARLQAFVAQQAKSGNRRTGEGLSCASVNLIITVLQNSLKCAREADMVGGYAAEKLRRPRAPARETACFDLSEQATLVRAAMQAKDEKFRGIVLCLYTGLRLGELLALEWGDVDWERGLLYVSRTCREGRDEAGRFGRIVGAPKSRRSVRVIPLSAEVRASCAPCRSPPASSSRAATRPSPCAPISAPLPACSRGSRCRTGAFTRCGTPSPRARRSAAWTAGRWRKFWGTARPPSPLRGMCIRSPPTRRT